MGVTPLDSLFFGLKSFVFLTPTVAENPQ